MPGKHGSHNGRSRGQGSRKQTGHRSLVRAQRTQAHSPEQVQQSEVSETLVSGSHALPVLPVSMLGSATLNGRGNAPVRAALIQQAQQTHGNRAVQRFLQRNSDSQAPTPVQTATMPLAGPGSSLAVQRGGITKNKGGTKAASQDIESLLAENEDARVTKLATAITSGKRNNVDTFNTINLILSGPPIKTQYEAGPPARDLRTQLTGLFGTAFGKYTVNYLMEVAETGSPSLVGRMMLSLGEVSVKGINPVEVMILAEQYSTAWFDAIDESTKPAQSTPPTLAEKKAKRTWISQAGFIKTTAPYDLLKTTLVRKGGGGEINLKRLYAVGGYAQASQPLAGGAETAQERQKRLKSADAYLAAIITQYLTKVKTLSRNPANRKTRYTGFDIKGFIQDLRTWGGKVRADERRYIVEATPKSKSKELLDALVGSTMLGRAVLQQKSYDQVLAMIYDPTVVPNLQTTDTEDRTLTEQSTSLTKSNEPDRNEAAVLDLTALLNRVSSTNRGLLEMKSKNAAKVITKVNSMTDIQRQQFIASLFANPTERSEYLDPTVPTQRRRDLFLQTMTVLNDKLKDIGLTAEQRAALLAKFEYGTAVGSTYQRLRELAAGGRVYIGSFAERALDLIAELEGPEYSQVRQDKQLLRALHKYSDEKKWARIARMLRIRMTTAGTIVEVEYKTGAHDTSGKAFYDKERDQQSTTGQQSEVDRDEIELRPKWWADLLHIEIGHIPTFKNAVIRIVYRAQKAGERRQHLMGGDESTRTVRFKHEDATYATNTRAGFMKRVLGYAQEAGDATWIKKNVKEGFDALDTDAPITTEHLLKYSKGGMKVIGRRESKEGIRSAFKDMTGKQLLDEWSNIAEFGALTTPDARKKFILDIREDRRQYLFKDTKMGAKERLDFINEIRGYLRAAAMRDPEFQDALQAAGITNDEWTREQMRARDMLDTQAMKDTGYQLTGTRINVGPKKVTINGQVYNIIPTEKSISFGNTGTQGQERKEGRNVMVGAVRKGRKDIENAPAPDKARVIGERTRELRTTEEDLERRTKAFDDERQSFLQSVTTAINLVVSVLLTTLFATVAPLPPGVAGAIKGAVKGIIEEALKRLILGDEFGSLRESLMNIVASTAAGAMNDIFGEADIFGSDSLSDMISKPMETGLGDDNQSYFRWGGNWADLGGKSVAAVTEATATWATTESLKLAMNRDPDEARLMLRNKVHTVQETLKKFANKSAVEIVVKGLVGDLVKQGGAEVGNVTQQGVLTPIGLRGVIPEMHIDENHPEISPGQENFNEQVDTLTETTGDMIEQVLTTSGPLREKPIRKEDRGAGIHSQQHREAPKTLTKVDSIKALAATAKTQASTQAGQITGAADDIKASKDLAVTAKNTAGGAATVTEAEAALGEASQHAKDASTTKLKSFDTEGQKGAAMMQKAIMAANRLKGLTQNSEFNTPQAMNALNSAQTDAQDAINSIKTAYESTKAQVKGYITDSFKAVQEAQRSVYVLKVKEKEDEAEAAASMADGFADKLKDRAEDVRNNLDEVKAAGTANPRDKATAEAKAQEAEQKESEAETALGKFNDALFSKTGDSITKAYNNAAPIATESENNKKKIGATDLEQSVKDVANETVTKVTEARDKFNPAKAKDPGANAKVKQAFDRLPQVEKHLIETQVNNDLAQQELKRILWLIDAEKARAEAQVAADKAKAAAEALNTEKGKAEAKKAAKQVADAVAAVRAGNTKLKEYSTESDNIAAAHKTSQVQEKASAAGFKTTQTKTTKLSATRAAKLTDNVAKSFATASTDTIKTAAEKAAEDVKKVVDSIDPSKASAATADAKVKAAITKKDEVSTNKAALVTVARWAQLRTLKSKLTGKTP